MLSFRYIAIVEFGILGIAFGVAGHLLLRTLKGTFKHFYFSVRKEVKVTVVMQVAIFLTRSIWNICLAFDIGKFN